MNKHLLQTKLKSILHYREEIKKLKEATKVTEETLAESLKALAEFWPYQKGDVLVVGKKMLRVIELSGMARPENPSFEVRYEEPVSHYSEVKWQTSQYSFTLPIADIDKVKVIEASIFE